MLQGKWRLLLVVQQEVAPHTFETADASAISVFFFSATRFRSMKRRVRVTSSLLAEP